MQQELRTADVVLPEHLRSVSFGSLLLQPEVLAGLAAAGLHTPSPVQLAAIPLGRFGLDIIAQAKSGSGKTCVFGVIALERVDLSAPFRSSPQVLILAPTRELALQITDVLRVLGANLAGLVCHAFIGGTDLAGDRQRLKRCHVCVGTPGRIEHLLRSGVLLASRVRLFVMDEADKLLEPASASTLARIVDWLPEHRQTLAFSATFDEHSRALLCAWLREPRVLQLHADQPALAGVRQLVFHAHAAHAAAESDFDRRLAAACTVLQATPFDQCIVFVSSCARAERVASELQAAGWGADQLTSRMAQPARTAAFERVRCGAVRLLVATDVLARGVDLPRLTLVVHFDLPPDCDTYAHRVGRAGRFGAGGLSVVLRAAASDAALLREFESRYALPLAPWGEPLAEPAAAEAARAGAAAEAARVCALLDDGLAAAAAAAYAAAASVEANAAGASGDGACGHFFGLGDSDETDGEAAAHAPWNVFAGYCTAVAAAAASASGAQP